MSYVGGQKEVYNCEYTKQFIIILLFINFCVVYLYCLLVVTIVINLYSYL